MVERDMLGWVGTHIEDARILPELAEYTPGTDVVFEGKLVVHGWPDWFPGGDQPISIYVGEVAVESGKTGPDGIFRIPLKLPFTAGTYVYRAHYSGSGWPAGWDPCTSDNIVVKVVGIGPPPCESHTTQSECLAAGCYWYDGACHSYSKPPPSPVDIVKYILIAAAAIAAVGVGYLLLKKRK